MARKRTIVGISAILCLVALNLRHAWNNYGITKDSRILKALATPPTDPPQKHECGSDENGNTKYCNARANEVPTIILCNHYYTLFIGKTPISSAKDKNGKYIYTTDVILGRVDGADDRGWVYEMPDFSYKYIKNELLTVDAIIPGTERMEHHVEEIAFSSSENECVYNPSTSCVPGSGLSTACKVEIERIYANGAT
ncbi:MAG: hypothetical protein K2N13_07340 [Paraprevotella sp.]|nr:hypothetical protein [Paraprevotella sp.]